mgnify:CR=1 FL=1
MTRETNNVFEQSRAFDQECRLQQRLGRPGSRAWQRRVEEAARVTQPHIEWLCDMRMIHGRTRVLIDAEGEVTVDTVLPPEIQQRVEAMEEVVQGIRNHILGTERWPTDPKLSDETLRQKP